MSRPSSGELYTILNSFINKVQPEWRVLNKLADSYLPKVANEYLKAFEVLRSSIDVEILATEPIPNMADRIDWKTFEVACDQLYSVTGALIVDAGRKSADFLSNSIMSKIKIKKKFEPTEVTGSFDIRNPLAVQWARTNVANNIKQVSDNTRQGVKVLIGNAIEVGGHPYETARKIRDMIGLTEPMMNTVLKYQMGLDEEGRSKKQVDDMVNTFIKTKLKARAETIARTETTAAVCAGQQLHWEDQMRKGYINNQDFEKVWITTPDDRLCPFCAAMHEERADIDGVFKGGLKQPPLHPNCRCSTGLVERKGQEIESYMPAANWLEIPEVGRPTEVNLQQAVMNIIEQYKSSSVSEKTRQIGKVIRKDFEPKLQKYKDEITELRAEYLVEKRESMKALMKFGKEPDHKVDYDAYRQWHKDRRDATKRYQDLSYEIEQKSKALQKIQRDAIIKSLSKIRKMGGADLTKITSTSGKTKDIKEARKAIKEIEKCYPQEWWDKCNLVDKKIDFGKADGVAGFYNGSMNLISVAVHGDSGSLAHEVGHMFEDFNSTIRYREVIFYQDRTKGEVLTKLIEYNVQGRNDNFHVDRYAGRELYGNGASEIFSTGIERLMFATDSQNLLDDEDFADFILGILGGV